MCDLFEDVAWFVILQSNAVKLTFFLVSLKCLNTFWGHSKLNQVIKYSEMVVCACSVSFLWAEEWQVPLSVPCRAELLSLKRGLLLGSQL